MRKLQQQIRFTGGPLTHTITKYNLKHQVEQAQNVAGVNGVKDKGNTLNTAMVHYYKYPK
ncbi:hypothetical protein ACVNPX_02250 [Staphylococcus aureus]